MKYALEVRVESTMKIPKETRVVREGLTMEFLSDESGLFTAVRTSADIPPGWNPPTVEIRGDNIRVNLNPPTDLKARMLTEFKVLESALAFCCPVQRLRWHGPKEEYIPETKQERETKGSFDASK